MSASRSRSRSRSSSSGSRRETRAKDDGSDKSMDDAPKREDSPPRERTSKVIEVDKDDAAFVLGRGGSTKRKIARVSGAEIELDEHALTITLSGTAKGCAHGIDYIDFVRQQRVGPVTINMDTPRDDFSAYIVPGDCIGFVMGRNGQTLRSMEEEWGVLMFFMNKHGEKGEKGKGRGGSEMLIICGPQRSRRGAELKVMSGVETKTPGYFTRGVRDKTTNTKGFDTDRMLFRDEDILGVLADK